MRRRALPLVLLLPALGGCAGSGGFDDPLVGLSLRGSADYNGRAGLGTSTQAGSSKGANRNGVSTIEVVRGDQRLLVSFPTLAAIGEESAEIAFGAQDTGGGGAAATYVQDGRRAWRSVSGTMRVRATPTGPTAFGTEGVAFAPDPTFARNGAAGSFTLTGSGPVSGSR